MDELLIALCAKIVCGHEKTSAFHEGIQDYTADIPDMGDVMALMGEVRADIKRASDMWARSVDGWRAKASVLALVMDEELAASLVADLNRPHDFSDTHSIKKYSASFSTAA